MCWEYSYLKRELGLPADPALDLFERFCERAYGVMDAMEWSWSFRAGTCRHNRVYWLGAPGRAALTSLHMKWLAGAWGLEPADLEGGMAAWLELLDRYTERAAVAYAGADAEQGRAAALKLYLTVQPEANPVVGPRLWALMPRLPRDTPLEGTTMVLCYAVYADRAARARVYLMNDQQDFYQPRVAQWLARAAGERALALAQAHVRAGISFKKDTTDTLGLAFRPSSCPLAEHPCWWNSPALDPVFQEAGNRPLLRERLRRLSWITVPITGEALAFPLSMPEMSVYVKLV
jgi:hypothetical protein